MRWASPAGDERPRPAGQTAVDRMGAFPAVLCQRHSLEHSRLSEHVLRREHLARHGGLCRQPPLCRISEGVRNRNQCGFCCFHLGEEPVPGREGVPAGHPVRVSVP